MMVMKWLSCEGCESEFSYPWLRWYGICTIHGKCTQAV